MVTVQTWADHFGNWHALVTGDSAATMGSARAKAYGAIQAELSARQGAPLDLERFGVTEVFQNGEQTEWVETWEGEGIPTRSDVVTCGECGKSYPPNVAPSARCPFEYDHAPVEIAGAEEESRVFGMWWGGHSYAQGEGWNYLEAFDSVEDARDALVERYESNGNRMVDFHYVNRAPDSMVVPAVGTESEMRIYRENPTNAYGSDYKPDMVLSLCDWEDGEVTPYRSKE